LFNLLKAKLLLLVFMKNKPVLIEWIDFGKAKEFPVPEFFSGKSM